MHKTLKGCILLLCSILEDVTVLFEVTTLLNEWCGCTGPYLAYTGIHICFSGKSIYYHFFIEFGPKMESGMAIRIGFVVLDGREPPKWRKLSIPSRIRGPVVIIILSRKRFSKKSPFNPIKTTNAHARNDRKDRGKISSFYTKSGFVMVFASQSRVFHGQRHFWFSV